MTCCPVVAMRVLPLVAGLFITAAASSGSTIYFGSEDDPFFGRADSSGCVRRDMEAALRNSSMKNLGEEEDLDGDLSKMEGRLFPIYRVLPKNEFGRLASSGVRYLLHRHFLRSHAWLVFGLAPDGGAWNESFPMATLEAWATKDLQAVIADHLDSRGLTLRETAVLATMLANRVHKEAVDRLKVVWRALDLDDEAVVDDRIMRSVIEDHAWTYLADMSDKDLHGMTLASLRAARDSVEYFGWSHTQQFLVQMQEIVTRGARVGLSFEVAEQIAMRVIEGFGGWQEDECKTLASELVQMESPRPGRVDLAAFHGSAAAGQNENFVESTEYLRQLGVLDESDPAIPALVISNYVNSPANFISNGRLFAVTCIDTCEDRLESIELGVGGPTATPEKLIAILQNQPSRGEGEQMNVSGSLVSHLQDVAGLHGGVVPLHGRLFALWLHHVYPRACPYPPQAGTTKPLLPMEYEQLTGLPSCLSPEELKQEAFRDSMREAGEPSARAPLPWDLHEELLQDDASLSGKRLQRFRSHAVPVVSSGRHMSASAVGATIGTGLLVVAILTVTTRRPGASEEHGAQPCANEEHGGGDEEHANLMEPL